MKNKIFRFITATLIAIVLLLSFCTVSFASEEADLTEENATVEGLTPENDASSQDEREGNIFATLFEEAKKHSTELISALTLTASVLLAFAYKKGLIPLLTNGLERLASGVNSIREAANESRSIGNLVKGEIETRLGRTEEQLMKLSEGIKESAELQKEKEKAAGEAMKLSLILTAQIDMLYEIFESSSLPEYKKEEVGRRIGKMKDLIKEIDEAKDTFCANINNEVGV